MKKHSFADVSSKVRVAGILLIWIANISLGWVNDYKIRKLLVHGKKNASIRRNDPCSTWEEI